MYDSLACRLCLATDVRLSVIAGTAYQDMYEKLTNTPLNSMEKPLDACYQCEYQLKKCQEFAERVIRTDELLTRMVQAGTEITSKSIAMVDRELHKLSANLATAPVEFYNLHDCQPLLEIKQETPVEMEVITSDMDNIKREDEGVFSVIYPEQHNTEDETIIQVKNSVLEEYSRKKSLISNNIEYHNPIKPNEYFNCDLCPYQGITRDSLEEHVIIHNDRTSPIQEGSSESEKCQSYNDLESTSTETHTKEKPYKCMICDYRCSVKEYMTKHIRKHTGDKPYECTECELRFGQKSNLTRHLKTHTAQKNNTCTVCANRCRVKEHLKEHIITHTIEKPYECAICHQRFSQKQILIQHLKIHTGDKPYQCTECKYRCIRKSDLNKHSRIHTGEKPFKCPVCEYRCGRKGNLHMHLRKHSKDKYPRRQYRETPAELAQRLAKQVLRSQNVT